MPRATVRTEAEHFNLKTCPGGYVKLRALSHGQLLDRRDRASKMSMLQNPDAKPGDPTKVNIDFMQRVTRQYEFEHCIVDHNLEDENGIKLNFGMPETLELLDPRIGQELERLIDVLNKEDDNEGDAANFPSQSGESSTETSEIKSNLS